jgi:hypothetical protein
MQLVKVSHISNSRDTWAVAQYSVLDAKEMSTEELTARLIEMRQRGERLPNRFHWQVEQCRNGRMVMAFPFMIDEVGKPFFWPEIKFPKTVGKLLDRAVKAFKAGSYFLDVWTPQDRFALYFRPRGIEGLQFIPADESGSAQWFDLKYLSSASQAFGHPVLRRYLSHIDQFKYQLTEHDKGWKVYAQPNQDA